jgi:arginine exporter protein ArgO
METLSTPFVSGLVAGLAVAVPLGAIGVLLLTEGLRHGLGRAWGAAAGVAAADALYGAVAVLFGAAAAPLVTGLAPWPAVTGGLVLLAVAARGLVHGLRTPASRSHSTTTSSMLPDRSPGPGRRLVSFFALTMVNPATLVFFAAVTTGLGGVARTPASGAAFVAGVGLASLAWQTLLVVAGSALSGRVGPAVQRLTTLTGNAVVAVLGVLVVAGALR